MKSFIFLILILIFFSDISFAAGTVSVSYSNIKMEHTGNVARKVTVSWTADAADGSVPNTTISGLKGFVLKVVTNPGSTAPTDNYDIAFGDPDDTALDSMATLLNNRDTANTEQVYPLISGASVPIFLAGDYQFQLTNNAVNSATGTCILYLVESL